MWIPEKQAVMGGDHFYRSCANLYAMRGTKVRNPMEWVESLDRIRLLNAEHLVPSHSRPISGKENVEKALTDYRDDNQFVHDQTIRYINKGLTPDEIVQKVKLPKHLAGLHTYNLFMALYRLMLDQHLVGILAGLVETYPTFILLLLRESSKIRSYGSKAN